MLYCIYISYIVYIGIFNTRDTRDFQNSPSFKRSAGFLLIISESCERFQCFNFETDFLENENLFQKTGLPFFS